MASPARRFLPFPRRGCRAGAAGLTEAPGCPALPGAHGVPAPSPTLPPRVPLGGHPHGGGRVVLRAPVAEWRRGDGNRLPISARPTARPGESQRVRASREALARPVLPPPARAGAGPASPAPFPPRSAAQLRHSGTAGRAGGWSARCPLPAALKMVTSVGQLALFALGTYCLPRPPTPASPGPPVALCKVGGGGGSARPRESRETKAF